MAFRVFIDPGHGGTDPGAVFNGRQEKDDVLRLALAVGRILEDHGIDVVYSRTEDFYDSPYEKAMKGNESEADLFLSLHRNAAIPPGSGTGADMLVYADTGFSSDVANQIGNAIAAAGLQFNGITERPNLAVLRRTKMPAVLVEAGFIDNESDNQFFDENFDALAQAIAQGVLNTIEQDQGPEEPVPIPFPTPRTDFPETFAMNTDYISAFADGDPAEMMMEQDYMNFRQRDGQRNDRNMDERRDRDRDDRWDRDRDGRRDRDRDDRWDRDRDDRRDWDRDDRWNRNRDDQWDSNRDDRQMSMNPPNPGSGNQPGMSMNPPNPGSGNQPVSPGRPSGPTSPGRPDRPGRPGDMNRQLFRVQVGAFSNPMFATQLLNQLLLEGFPAFIVYSDGLYRVQVGAFALLENAVRMEQRLRSQGYQTYITT